MAGIKRFQVKNMQTTSSVPPMRRQDRALSSADALAIFERAEVAAISVITEQGPYGFPISPVLLGTTLYFHSALSGRKVDAFARDPRVWVSAWTDVHAAADKFTTYFESAMASGAVRAVTAPEERRRALAALCRKFTPDNMADFENALRRSDARTAVWAIALENITGKAKRHH